MGKRDEWYRSPEWDEEAQTLFNTKIKRSRKGYSRAQYYRLKASALFYGRPQHGPPHAHVAVELLQRALADSDAASAQDICQLHEALGHFCFLLGDRDLARTHYTRTVGLLVIDDRKSHGRVSPEELLARMAGEDGRYAEAIRWMKELYRHRSRYIPAPDFAQWASRAFIDAGGEPYTHPDHAAEAVVVWYHAPEDDEPSVPEVFGNDRSGLDALDRHFAHRKERSLELTHSPRQVFKREFLEERFLVSLGSYVGRVLVEEYEGHWVVGHPIATSRVEVAGEGPIDPFEIAFNTVYYELPLVGQIDRQLIRDRTS